MDRAKRTWRLTRAVATSIRHMCEQLEARVMLSKATIVDAGEHYHDFNNGTDVSLLRATDQVVVGFEPSSTSRQRRLAAAIVGSGAPLEGYRLRETIAHTTAYVFERTARGYSPSWSKIQADAGQFPAIKYTGPTYFQSVDNARVIPTDQVEINLQNGVDPAAFFAKRYSSYTRGGFGSNAYIATLRVGGAVDAVRVATLLTGNSQVDYALPVFASELVLSSGPVMLSKARIVDAREVYRDFNTGQDVPMLRATDQVVVGFATSSNARQRRLAAALIADDAPLAGYRIREMVAQTTAYVFERTARGISPELGTIQDSVGKFPAIKYVGPTYFEILGGIAYRVIATDHIAIDLKPGIDPAAFFAKGYASWSPFGQDSYLAVLKTGGATDTVRVATTLTGNAQVAHATPDFAFEITPA